MKRKIKNPLRKRVGRELLEGWRKYLVVFLFLVLTIGFVSGMYVANESMMSASRSGVTSYKLEYGHFELSARADDSLLSAIATGEKADVKQFYLDKAPKRSWTRSLTASSARSLTASFRRSSPLNSAPGLTPPSRKNLTPNLRQGSCSSF